MRFYDLGKVAWQEAQALVYALAHLGREGAVLARPDPLCLCVGNQVDLEQAVNIGACRAQGIPVVRRDSTSRSICLAKSRLALQVVQHDDKSRWSGVEGLRTILMPFWQTCHELDLEVEYRAPNEILVHDKQIVNACTCIVNHCSIAAATLTLEFDPRTFISIFDTQDDMIHSRLAELVQARRTSLRQELEALPSDKELTRRLLANLQLVAGGLHPGVIDKPLRTKMDANVIELTSIYKSHSTHSDGWSVYIGAGAEIRRCSYRAPGGLLRATCEWQDGRIVRAILDGDFFCYPPGGLYRLENALVGVRRDQVAEKISDFYCDLGLVTPGIQPAHWVKVLAPLPP